MSDLSQLTAQVQNKLGSRSMGLKLIVVAGLALLMTIPSFFVSGLVGERTGRAFEVTREIGDHVGGQQSFLGPTLVIPYTTHSGSASIPDEHGNYLVFPAQGSATVKTRTEERHRSLFKVPVYQADLHFDAAFDMAGVPSAAPANTVLDWQHAVLVVGVSDARGALADGTVSAVGKSDTLVPVDGVEGLSNGNTQDKRPSLTLFGVSVSQLAKPEARFNIAADLRFSGAQRLSVLAYGKSTHLAMTGDWPSPSFDGGFLPVNRNISPSGFTAQWSIPFIARGVRAEGRGGSISGFDNATLGVSFVELADPYQSVSRSLKYALLFLGLLFLSYFVFETTTGRRVHPAQYVLVGIAQLIFYLLLLSFAERIGFDWGFLLAGGATVLLLSANAAWIFASRLHGLRALASFSLLYALIYMLLRLEDNALLVGAIASFLAVAAVMYFTRKIDWYSSLPGQNNSAGVSIAPRSDVD